MVDGPALMLATVTRARLFAPWTLTMLSDADRVRVAWLLNAVPTDMDPVPENPEIGAPRMWY